MKKILSLLVVFLLIINVFLPIVFAINEDNEVFEEFNNETVNEVNENNELMEEINNEIVNEVTSPNESIEKSNSDIIDEELGEDENCLENKKVEENVSSEELKEEQEKNNFVKNTPVMLKGSTSVIPHVFYRTHVQSIGWQDYFSDGEMAGTEGKGFRLEGINIKLTGLENVNVTYQTHIQNIGWQNWKKNDEMSGTEGLSYRLEAIRIRLEDTDNYSIMYRVHIQNIGWQSWKCDGELAGTEGQSLRLEGIEIKIIDKRKKARINIDSGLNNQVYYSPTTINVSGWKMANISNSEIEAYIDNKKIDLANITNYEREDVIKAILDYGSSTQNKTPGFTIKIPTSDLAAGTHTVKINVINQDSEVLTSYSSKFIIDKNLHVQYRTHVQSIGWQNYFIDGAIAGTLGQSLRVEAMNISLINAPSNGRIIYRTHVQNIGWQGWESNGGLSGTLGQALRIEAFQIKLENMSEYTVEYRAHIQSIGWTDWYIDGETAGTIGKGLRVEAIQIRIVNHYVRNYKGIDVSAHQGRIDWNSVKNDGIDFAIIRCGYGQDRTSQDDLCFAQNIMGCKAAGIPYGIYFYSYALSENDVYSEAQHVIRLIKTTNANPTFGIWFDMEDADTYKQRYGMPSNGTLVNMCKIFCDELSNNGYSNVGIYANLDWFTNRLNDSKLDKYEKWVAEWGPKCNYKKPYSIWQYSNAGHVNGITGNVDMDICYTKH